MPRAYWPVSTTVGESTISAKISGGLAHQHPGDGAITLQINGYTDDLWLDELQLKPHAQP